LVDAITHDLMDREEAPTQLKFPLDRAQSHITHWLMLAWNCLEFNKIGQSS